MLHNIAYVSTLYFRLRRNYLIAWIVSLLVLTATFPISFESPARLTPGGYLLLEMDTDQIETVVSYATDYRYQVVKRESFHLLMRLPVN